MLKKKELLKVSIELETFRMRFHFIYPTLYASCFRIGSRLPPGMLT